MADGVFRNRRRLLPAALAASVLSLASGRALATTACGNLITNIASATMWTGAPDFVAYEVSYSVTAALTVLCPPVIALRKSSDINGNVLATAPSGGIVTFKICLENQQFGPNDSIWNVVINDRLPDNMVWSGEPATAATTAFNPGDYNTSTGANYTASWASSMAGPWTLVPVSGVTGTPLYLRWTISLIGPPRSACVTYRAKVL